MTNSLTPWRCVFHEKLTVPKLDKKLPTVYEVEHSLPCPNRFLSCGHIKPVHVQLSCFLRCILISFSHLYLHISSGPFPSGFPNKPCDFLPPLPYVPHT